MDLDYLERELALVEDRIKEQQSKKAAFIQQINEATCDKSHAEVVLNTFDAKIAELNRRKQELEAQADIELAHAIELAEFLDPEYKKKEYLY